MKDDCQLVVFSNKAYNAIIRESFEKDPVETGGILLGHILDNGIWIIMEVLPPGINSIFQYAYFEYDDSFVNYLAQSVANQYKRPLDLLGLWHRHPGSLDTFSQTDDMTNATFARQNPKGVISGLVNIDPRFRFTMYHLDHDMPVSRYGRPYYTPVEIEVGDDLIPEEYFQLKFYNGDEADLHPLHRREEIELKHRVKSNEERQRELLYTEIEDGVEEESEEIRHPFPKRYNRESSSDFFGFWRNPRKRWIYLCGGIALLVLVTFSLRGFMNSVEDTKDFIEDYIPSKKIPPIHQDSKKDNKKSSDKSKIESDKEKNNPTEAD